MNLDLNDKHIIVAGGLGGIGSKTVDLLIEEGARVTVFTQSRNYKDHNFKKSDKLSVVKTNYSNENILEKDILSANTKQKLNGLIIMVGNGRSEKEIFLKKVESKRIWNLNYFIPRNISESFVKVVQKSTNEENNSELFITFCSSIAAQIFLNAPTEYSVAKSALEKLTKELSWKLAPLFRVNCISPGNIFFKGGTWDKIQRSGEVEITKMLNEKVPMQRFGLTLDIAYFAVFLSSSKVSSFFNGACVKIDGGQTTSL